MKIFEVVGQPDPRYFLEEGCAIFAMVLHRMLGRGEFYVFADISETADKWGRSGYEYTHAVLGVDGRLYDVRGARTKEDVAEEFIKHPEHLQLLGPFAAPEFRQRFVGNQKPFYGPTPDTVQEAETIIRAAPERYGIPPAM